MKLLETEVKFCPMDIGMIRGKLLAMGAKKHGRVFETNIRFEDHCESLGIKKKPSKTSKRYKGKANI